MTLDRDLGAHGRFTETFGRAPTVIAEAPGRVNLIGEHTDYNDGFVLPVALPLGVQVAVAGRGDNVIELRSSSADHPDVTITTDELQPTQTTGWAAYVAGVVWSLREAGHDVGGMELVVASDLPAGRGLASSAALECAALVALDRLHGYGLDEAEAARLAHRAENQFVGMPCGVMDQTASMRCVDGHALFLDTRTLAIEHVPFNLVDDSKNADSCHSADHALIVIDTGVRHSLVDSEYAARRGACELAALRLGVDALRDISIDQLDGALARLDDDDSTRLRRLVRHVVTENDRVQRTVELLRTRRIAEIGTLLTASHVSLRDDYQVSCPELDVAVEAALAAGAQGARMTGGGFGGCAIALTDHAAVDRVTDGVRAAFARHRFASPVCFGTAASAGARVLSDRRH